MAPDKFKKRLLIGIGIALGVFAVLAGVIFFLNADINNRLEVVRQYKNDLALRGQTILLLSNLRKESERAEELAKTLGSVLPTRDDLISFPKELLKIATKDNIEFGFSFGVEAAATATDPGTVRFTMSLGGELQNLITFLTDIEHSGYFISLGSVDLTRRENGGYALGTGGQVYIQ